MSAFGWILILREIDMNGFYLKAMFAPVKDARTQWRQQRLGAELRVCDETHELQWGMSLCVTR